MKKKRLTEDQVTLEMCQHSDFGCPNCLWQFIECKNFNRFSPKVSVVDGEASCKSYSYYD